MHLRGELPSKRWQLPHGPVLVLSPHPDDETIGCGGTIILHRRRGDKVKVVFVTDGEAGDPRGRYRGRDYRALRRAEARRAAAVLGVEDVEFWGCSDGALAAARGLRERLEEILRKEKPRVVYRPSPQDPHPDHRALAASFKRAASKVEPRFIDCQYEVCFLQQHPIAIDISSVFAKKTAALRQYRSQLRYRDYVAQSARVNVFRSLLLNRASYAEAFQIS